MDLFDNIAEQKVHIAEGAIWLRGFALQNEAQILADLNLVLSQSPLRHMVTPGGFTMSVAMTNCGDLGWVSDKNGYRYDALDPSPSSSTGAPWRAMPMSFLQLANNAAAEAGYANFVPDACLINQYKPAARMSLHQDKDERDFTQPIVSVSLGVPAMFLFGGLKRSDKPLKILLQHGDIVVWGGKSRLNYHGVMPLQPNIHAAFGACRFNLTFRKAA
jgi:alkylated DNA repair protein (DNA oxidative demethylase)